MFFLGSVWCVRVSRKGFQGSVFFRGSVWGVQGYSNESPCRVCERPTISLDPFFPSILPHVPTLEVESLAIIKRIHDSRLKRIV